MKKIRNYPEGISIYCGYCKKMLQECRNFICEADFNDFGSVTGQVQNSCKKPYVKFRINETDI